MLRDRLYFLFLLFAQSHMTLIHAEVGKKAFLNLWSMVSSILTVNWVFLGEWSESGSAEVTARNDNTRLDYHLHASKTSTLGQVFPIFLLFLPSSFQMVCWDEHMLANLSVSLYHPTTPGGEDAHQCYAHVLPNPAEEDSAGTACSAGTAFSWIFMPPCPELRSDKSYDTWKYSVRVAINNP